MGDVERLEIPVCLNLVIEVDGGHVTWPSTRRQWHQLCHFLSQLRVSKAGREAQLPPTSLLELTLSYIVVNGGARYHSGVPDSDGGGRIGTQMNQMAFAILAAQKLLRIPELLPKHRTHAARTQWGQRYGMIPQLLLSRPVWVPEHGRVVEMIEGMGGELDRMDLRELPTNAERWRRWHPGIPESQTQDAGRLPARPQIYGMTVKRLRTKSSLAYPTRVALEARALRARLWALPQSHTMVGGKRVFDWVEEWGCARQSDLKAMMISFKCKASQARKLLANLETASMRGTHLVRGVMGCRPICYRCGVSGNIGIDSKWVLQKCLTFQGGETANVVRSLLEAELRTLTWLCELLSGLR